MKLSVTWQEEDIKIGRWIYKRDTFPTDDIEVLKQQAIDYFISTAHMIGYSVQPEAPNLFHCAALADGMVWGHSSDAKGLADKLSNGNYMPLPAKLLARLIAHHTNIVQAA